MKTLDLFTTPLFHCNIEQTKPLLTDLENLALEHEANHESGRNVSNVGGHQTPFLSLEDEPKYEQLIETLMPEIRNTVQGFNYRNYLKIIVLKCWININRKGHLNWPHTHPNTDWACIFYIKSDEKTAIRFKNPDPMRTELHWKIDTYNQYNADVYSYFPKTNDFIMIPAHVEHSVDVSKSEDVRISLAFNVRIA